MPTKEFSQQLHDENDPIARKVVIDFLKNIYEECGCKSVEICENPNIFGIDLILKVNGNETSGIEVERRSSWDTFYFPFDTINVPARKLKFHDKDKHNKYIAVNKDMTRALVLVMSDIVKSPMIENPNKYVEAGEMFYSVDVNKACFYKLAQKFSSHLTGMC